MRRKRNENENRNMSNEKTFQVPVAQNGFSIPRSEWNFHKVVNCSVEKKGRWRKNFREGSEAFFGRNWELKVKKHVNQFFLSPTSSLSLSQFSFLLEEVRTDGRFDRWPSWNFEIQFPKMPTQGFVLLFTSTGSAIGYYIVWMQVRGRRSLIPEE